MSLERDITLIKEDMFKPANPEEVKSRQTDPLAPKSKHVEVCHDAKEAEAILADYGFAVIEETEVSEDGRFFSFWSDGLLVGTLDRESKVLEVYTGVAESLEEGIASARDLYLKTNKIAKTPFDRLVLMDPTKEKGKYVEWMVRTYVKNRMHYGDIPKFGVVKDFDELATKGIVQNKDINTYSSVEELYDEVKKHEDVKTQGEIEKEVKVEGSNIIFKNSEVVVIQPTTREASCYYGKGTKWCTAGDVYNYFNDYFYNRGVNLYYVIPRTGDNNDKIAVAVEPDGDKEYYAADDSRLDDMKAKRLLRKWGIGKRAARKPKTT
jgi:hypothetical protein